MPAQIGSLYLFTPFTYEYNTECSSPPKVAILLGRKENMQVGQWIILGGNGVEYLWNNRWFCEPISESAG